jgi:molybdate transport system regulatory protein
MTRLTIRIDFASGASLGPGKVRLLEAVEENGSIRKAAEAVGMSFRQAWLLLQAVEELFGEPVIETVRGGTKGGGAKLTSLGREVVAHYRGVENAAKRANRANLEAFAAKISPSGKKKPASAGVAVPKRKALKRR